MDFDIRWAFARHDECGEAVLVIDPLNRIEQEGIADTLQGR
jgi:hypothetical protein